MLGTRALIDETLGKMYYSFDALNGFVFGVLVFFVESKKTLIFVDQRFGLLRLFKPYFKICVYLFLLSLWFPMFCTFLILHLFIF